MQRQLGGMGLQSVAFYFFNRLSGTTIIFNYYTHRLSRSHKHERPFLKLERTPERTLCLSCDAFSTRSLHRRGTFKLVLGKQKSYERASATCCPNFCGLGAFASAWRRRSNANRWSAEGVCFWRGKTGVACLREERGCN